MAGSENFFKTTIELVNQRNVDLTGKEEIIHSEIMICLSEVEAFRQCVDDEDSEIDPNRCYVYMKSGQSYIINTPYNKFALYLNKLSHIS